MSKHIELIKTGNIVNFSIDGKLYKKLAGSPKEADDLYRLILKAKLDPTPENIKAIRMAINEKTRTAMMAGLECDLETNNVYMDGFNTPVPARLVELIKEYHEKGFPFEPIKNFWKLLMINPDIRVRENLFDFIAKHDFVITDSGYFIVYKAVVPLDIKINTKTKSKASKDAKTFNDFLEKEFDHVTKVWKCSANKYSVYKSLNDNVFKITKTVTSNKWDEKAKEIQILGKLGDLYNAIEKIPDVNANVHNTAVPADSNVETFTDRHTKKMYIQLGVPSYQKRNACDSDPRTDCSKGLHVGSTKYVEGFAYAGDTILICLVNPANVIAVPKNETSKIRVCEYFPFAKAKFEDGKINIINQSYYESDYKSHEEKWLNKMIAKVKANEPPIDINTGEVPKEPEYRNMAEIQKIIESRLVDIIVK